MGNIEKEKNNMGTPLYTKAVGQKFHHDGSVREFPGNTVISKITPDMPIYEGLVDAQERLKVADTTGRYAFLPPSSFHMTVIEGLCDQVRTAEQWSKKLALDLPLDEANQFIRECFSRITPPPSLTMTISKTVIPRWLGIVLEPADAETTEALQHFRNQFALETGIRFPNHETYTYHISLAYHLIVLTADEEHRIYQEQQRVQQALSDTYPKIMLQKPCLTYFDNMYRFGDTYSGEYQ